MKALEPPAGPPRWLTARRYLTGTDVALHGLHQPQALVVQRPVARLAVARLVVARVIASRSTPCSSTLCSSTCDLRTL